MVYFDLPMLVNSLNYLCSIFLHKQCYQGKFPPKPIANNKRPRHSKPPPTYVLYQSKTNNINRPTKHALPLTWPTFPLSRKLGDFVDYRKCVQSINYFWFLVRKTNNWILSFSWSLYYKVKQTKTNLHTYFYPFS